MTLLQGLHGSVAIILICVLLFIDESGVPLPIAPNEGILVISGILIASGAFPIWLILPAVFLAMLAGMLTGYTWAKALGQAGLRSVAQRVGAERIYDRAEARLQRSGPTGIGVCRVLPGVRPYGTLVCGAAGVRLRTFLLGAIPALLVWEIVWIGVGVLLGLPAVLFLGRFEKLAVRGVVLVVLGVAVWIGIHRIPQNEHGGLVRVRPYLRTPLALGVDGGISACVVIGLMAIARRLVHTTTNAWIELLAIGVLLAIIFIAGRTGNTPGEIVLDARYWGAPPRQTGPGAIS